MITKKMDDDSLVEDDVRFWNDYVDSHNFTKNFTDTTSTDENPSPDHYMLVFEDIDQYFNHISLPNGTDFNPYERNILNCNLILNGTNITCPQGVQPPDTLRNYWALILVLFPIFTLFGNVLVILSVYRERTLQTATNYFIVSLALADLLVAVVVMPFAVYVLVSERIFFLYI